MHGSTEVTTEEKVKKPGKGKTVLAGLVRRASGVKLPDSRLLGSIDFTFLVVVLVLVAFGLGMVFSASYYYSINNYDNPFYYLIRDGVWVVLGLVLMWIGTIVDYRKYWGWYIVVLGVMILLLIVVLTPIGIEVNGARRWLGVGSLTIMPGELVKMGLILFIARYFSEKPERIHSWKEGMLPMLGIMIVCALLIIKQPNLSTAITVCGIIVCMMLICGMKWRYVGFCFAAGAVGIFSIVTFLPNSHWASRITSFLDPFADMLGDGYQVAQSLLALGSGGLFGVGIGKSVQKSLYLPEPQNDFILAIIGEELGFVGVLALLLVYCIFIWRGVRIAMNAPDQFGMLIASGIVIMVALQVILNVAVVTSTMPATGINLPYVSYGGNALMMFMFLAGVMLNISRHEQ